VAQKESFIEMGASLKFDSSQKDEWAVRCELAAAYRLADEYGWMEGIGNHFTVRVPGEPEHFLINAFGQGYGEVTASSLVKIDHEGNVVDAGTYSAAINKAGFVIHSTVHHARADANCVMHTHEDNVTAVSAMKCGLLPISQTALVCGKIAYHEFQGVAVNDAERESLTEDIGGASVLMLRNHGVLTTGATVAEAFTRLYYIHKAATIQVKAMAASSEFVIPTAEVQKLVVEDQSIDSAGMGSFCEATFQMLRRKVDKLNPGYDQ
jgi:ribulose-5-phosphate 4-epimerase/fuculose-1-phosphate aldolase